MKTSLSIRSAFTTVASAGTAVPLVAVSATTTKVIHHGAVALVARKARAIENTGNVYLGDRHGQNLSLAPGGHLILRATSERVIDLTEILVDAETSGDGVLWVWVECEAELATALTKIASGNNTIGKIGPAQSNALPTNTAGTPFTILTTGGDVFTLSTGETGFIQNHAAAALNFKLGTGCSTTSLSGRMQACGSVNDGTGGFEIIRNWIGIVSVADVAGGAPRFSAWKI